MPDLRRCIAFPQAILRSHQGSRNRLDNSQQAPEGWNESTRFLTAHSGTHRLRDLCLPHGSLRCFHGPHTHAHTLPTSLLFEAASGPLRAAGGPAYLPNYQQLDAFKLQTPASADKRSLCSPVVTDSQFLCRVSRLCLHSRPGRAQPLAAAFENSRGKQGLVVKGPASFLRRTPPRYWAGGKLSPQGPEPDPVASELEKSNTKGSSQ